MNWKLEQIVVPAGRIDVAKDFYVDKMGFGVLMDVQLNPQWRLIHLFPPGATCEIAIGNVMTDGPPGSANDMHLMVDDVERKR